MVFILELWNCWVWIRGAGIAPGTWILGFSHPNHSPRFILGWNMRGTELG